MTDRGRIEFLYDGTPESGDRLVEFMCGMNPHNCAGGELWVRGENVRPGDIVQREDWGETAFDGVVQVFRFCVRRGIRH